MIQQLTLSNLLSFGKEIAPINLNHELNILIGANSSGKSNLIEVISLLQATSTDLTKPILDGGGIREWLWKGENFQTEAILQAAIKNPFGPMPLKHILCITDSPYATKLKQSVYFDVLLTD